MGTEFPEHGPDHARRRLGFSLILSSMAGAATVSVAGTHIINAGVTLKSDAAINVAGPGDSLTVNGRITDSGASNGITLSGGGLLVLANTNNAYGSGTTLNGGRLRFAALGCFWAVATSPFVAARSNTLPGAVSSPIDVSNRFNAVPAGQQAQDRHQRQHRYVSDSDRRHWWLGQVRCRHVDTGLQQQLYRPHHDQWRDIATRQRRGKRHDPGQQQHHE